MRILHFIPTLGAGGAERQLLLLTRELAARGHDVHVATVAGGVHAGGLDARVHLHRLKGNGNHDPRLLNAATRLARSVRPDLVQTWLTQMDVIGGFAARRAGVPWILTERSSAPAYERSLKSRIRARLGARADAIVANSVGGLAWWKSSRTRSRISRVIPNGIDLARIDGIEPAQLPVPDGTVVILAAGRLAPEKNLALLLDAMNDLLSHHDVTALICGEGSDRSALEGRAERLGVSSRVVFAGYREDLIGVMKSARLFVSLSQFEGHPNAVLEAMASGCPLVLSDIPAHTAMLGAGEACFVEGCDSAAVAVALRSVLDNDAEAQRRAAAARLRAENFTVGAMANAFEQLYNDVCELGRNTVIVEDRP